MKKRFLALSLSAILSLSAFVVCGCTQNVKTYEIFVTSSNLNQGGSAYGSGNYKENTCVTLTANPKSNSTFLAWVKDNENIISYNNEYSFIANEKTAGKYTALFDSNNYEFVKLASVSYNIYSFKLLEQNEDYQVTINSFNLLYNTKPVLYKTLGSFEEQDLENDADNYFDEINTEDKLFYLDNTYNFKLEMDLQYFDENTQEILFEHLETPFVIDFSNIFDNNNSKEQTVTGTKTTFKTAKFSLIMEGQDEKHYTLTLNYNSLSQSSMWDNTSNAISDNIQELSIVFSYPIIE